MNDVENRIRQLTDHINALQYKQREAANELSMLAAELSALKRVILPVQPINTNEKPLVEPVKLLTGPETVKEPPRQILEQKSVKQPANFASNRKLEDFIGRNLISKVGIIITLVGIFIGAKYTIDNNLIGAGMRILFGYLAGTGLITIALLLKRNYIGFSAVLMGGGLAVLYFITYVAYGFYQLFPQAVTFSIMVIITTSTVLTARWYNTKIIAVIGQVGAYAIPFLLSNGSGKVLILFSYISIINIGLLVLSLRKNWKVLYRLAFFLTWFIYISWLLFKQPQLRQESIGYVFSFINFFTFYFTFLFYKVIKKEPYHIMEIGVLLINALLFFFYGSYLIDDVFKSAHALTYFALLNAAIHFAIGYIIFRMKLADQTVHKFITGLGILFITITIPAELDGSWVTLLWGVEAVVLFYIGVRHTRNLYLSLSLPVISIAVVSLLQDWLLHYPYLYGNEGAHEGLSPAFLNITFFISLFVSVCLGFITHTSLKKLAFARDITKPFFKNILPVLFFALLFLTIFNEIHLAWDQVIHAAAIHNAASDNRVQLRWLSLLIFAFLYVALFFTLNERYIKSNLATKFLLVPAILCGLIFVINGLDVLSQTVHNAMISRSGSLRSVVVIRYLTFSALAGLILACRSAINNLDDKNKTPRQFTLSLHGLLLVVLCSEYIHWLNIAGYQTQNRLGITIICGLYAMALIITGIKNRARHLRIAAMVLFGATLLKLFFYDLANLSTVSKTIVLVILGVLLLIISFLYNKFKELIFGDEK